MTSLCCSDDVPGVLEAQTGRDSVRLGRRRLRTRRGDASITMFRGYKSVCERSPVCDVIRHVSSSALLLAAHTARLRDPLQEAEAEPGDADDGALPALLQQGVTTLFLHCCRLLHGKRLQRHAAAPPSPSSSSW